MRAHPPLVLASALALGLVVVACGDDDGAAPDDGTSSSSSGGTDAGPNPNPPDGATPDGGPPPGCTFASYVLTLVNGSTTATAQPDTTLGASCADSTSQDEFKSLFP